MILESGENGPLIWPTIEENGVTRPKKYSELSATKAIQVDCDVKATNIILQGLPLEKKWKTLRDFYLRFSLLLNDMNIYNVKLEQFQVNTKFLKTLPPEWSKFVTDVKLVWDLHITNIDQLHAYLGQHEFHANELRNSSNPRQKATTNDERVTLQLVQRRQISFATDLGIPEGQARPTIITHIVAYQVDDLDAYDFDCDKLNTAKVALMANLSHYDSDVLAEVHNPDNVDNSMINQDPNPSKRPTKVEIPKELPKVSMALKTKSWLWHRRLSHLNFGTINHLTRHGLIRGLPKLKFEKDHLCSACAKGKSKKKLHKPKSKDTSQEKLYLLHMDLCGPMRVTSVNGKKTDNGTEFVNQTLGEYYYKVGISYETSVARSPQQNSVVKRRNHRLIEVKPKNFKQAITEPSWIDAMQEEIHEFKRLQVWELVSCPDKVLLIKLKWIYKVRTDEFGRVLKNKARLDNPSHVYKLKKALYGLKPAPRAIMSITKEQQQALNDDLVPREQRLSIGKRLKTTTKVTTSGKKKLHAQGFETLSEIALTETEQMKIITKKSKIDIHSLHASGSGADEGSGVSPGVLDVPTYRSKNEQISWKYSDDEDDDEVSFSKDDDDDAENDDGQDNDNEQSESDNDGDDFVHPKFSTHDEEERQDEEDTDEEGLDREDVPVTTNVEMPPSAVKTLPPPPVPLVQPQHQTLVFPPVFVPSTYLQNLPTFGSLFEFKDRVKYLEDDFSEFKQTNQFAEAISSVHDFFDKYLDNRMNEAVKVAVQQQSDRLREEAQAEKEDFINKLDENIKKIIKEQVKVHVKEQVSKILPRIKKLINEQLKAEVMTRLSNEAMTSYVVAANLSELELKKILIDKMKSNKSIHRSDQQKTLYKALIDAYETDKVILDTYGDTGSKRRRAGKEPKSSSAQKEKTSKSSGKSKEGSKSHQMSTEMSAQADELIYTTKDLEEHAPQEFNIAKPLTPDRDWNKTLPAAHGLFQLWISNLAQKEDTCYSFNELMDTPLDFTAFVMKVYKSTIDQLDWNNPEGRQYPHDLRYPLPLIPNSQGRRVIPFDHFINNDLAYLRGCASNRTYATSVTKTMAVDYGHIKWIKDLIPNTMWSQVLVIYDKHALWRISHWGRKRQQFYGFTVNRESAHNHLDWIIVHRDDDKLYTFKEGDYKRLRLQDIKDLLLLLVQGNLTNLIIEECLALNVSLRMFTRSIVIKRHLKRLPTYSAYPNPRGLIYQNKDKKNKLLRIDELHKFSDGTLNDVQTALDDILKRIRMKYLLQTFWRNVDKEREGAMIQAIDKQLKNKRIIRSLKKFIGGRPYKGDFRLLKRTI
uniref:Retrovirus-related Pol polyprotein from transposon TNT 1-94 n=1 Tax=Tanacetum cinerariifolium TaxID=118510 RepID=A0A6L2P5R8_TANCI|nr:retrovirus-related Pol polyprotein from transposon TNT 1-94 [Tanacetum cinerariifolium]